MNEDIQYTVSDFATPDEKKVDPDQPNKSVLQEVSEFLAEQIEKLNTQDMLDLKETELTVKEQIGACKAAIIRLRTVELMVNNKLKELL